LTFGVKTVAVIYEAKDAKPPHDLGLPMDRLPFLPSPPNSFEIIDLLALF
jgi:hypothetical protein